jgi:hypothetical protein
VAIERAILLIPHQGPGQCAAIDIAHEPGTDLDDAKVLGACPLPPAGLLSKIGSGICDDHIKQLDREGGFILE